ncbi:hypothetical protein BDP27DRAFT_1455356 [Rhodocollybia butyracea]|uniref:Uncharacterized protein n=1 Tax=Rhodocollybia butyracea TaxID=206335 RepID=A0A9P5P2Q8_9AGAR|nr:hypothetical protein BDP27DRAFT_1455356 [Rhodocollybia butyracea]
MSLALTDAGVTSVAVANTTRTAKATCFDHQLLVTSSTMLKKAQVNQAQVKDDARRLRRCKLDLEYWYIRNPDGPPPHPSDDAYKDPATNLPPSAWIRRSTTLSPRFSDFSTGHHARESFVKHLLPAWSIAFTNRDQKEFLVSVVKLWLCIFPEDILPEQPYRECVKSSRLTVSQLPFDISTYKSELHKRCTLKTLMDTPERVVERDRLVQHMVDKSSQRSSSITQKAQNSLYKDRPRSFFTEALSQAIEACLERGTKAYDPVIARKDQLSWQMELDMAFKDWFYHQRMPFSFHLLYPPVNSYQPFEYFTPEMHRDFYWVSPIFALPPGWMGIAAEDSECRIGDSSTV